ncbi:hypothetical protein BJV82DRAFT_663645 [Fennellomyces sp. T-0311]|nr:hypothetical protein BJV82DRAFT_663645 [Fennellomyces sp. T-0311]
MVQLIPLLTTLCTIPFLVAQAAPTEITNLIHAQSFSELKDYVPMQRLGQDGLPVDSGVSAAAASMPFRPIMVVPLPSSVSQVRPVKMGAKDDLRLNKYRNFVVGMDDQGQFQTVQLPATSALAPAPTPLANSKNLVGMEDNGAVQTLALPLTTAAPTPSVM